MRQSRLDGILSQKTGTSTRYSTLFDITTGCQRCASLMDKAFRPADSGKAASYAARGTAGRCVYSGHDYVIANGRGRARQPGAESPDGRGVKAKAEGRRRRRNPSCRRAGASLQTQR